LGHEADLAYPDQLKMMNPTDPDNAALDALCVRSFKHPELRVELCRALLEAELYTLIPQGPVDGAEEGEEVRLEAATLPLMTVMRDGKPHFFLYTSEAMARKGLRKLAERTPQRMAAVSMAGRLLLTLMNRPGASIMLNPGAVPFDFAFNGAVLTGMLDGTMFNPPPAQPAQGTMQALRPEQYPLKLVQPVFDYLKTRPEVQAAWVLEMTAARERGKAYYVFALLTSEEKDLRELEHAVSTVLGMVDFEDRRGMEFGTMVFDYGDPAQVRIMRAYVPFYAAPGYQAPALAGGE